MAFGTIRVFIADDYMLLVETLKNLLENCKEFKFKVVGVLTDANQIIEALSGQSIDILLLDYRMPGINQMAAIENINKAYPDIKIVILTGYDSMELAKELIAIGVKGFLSKGIDRKELLEAINLIYRGEKIILVKEDQPDYCEKIMDF